jgi:hypothetical protein
MLTFSLRRFRIAPLLGALLTVGVLSSCGSPDPERALVNVELGRYTITPSDMTTPAGRFAIRVTNVDTELVHSLVVAGWGTRQLQPGESQTLPVDIKVGEYKMWCDIPGHAALGQVGVLRTGEKAAPATTAAASAVTTDGT